MNSEWKELATVLRDDIKEATLLYGGIDKKELRRHVRKTVVVGGMSNIDMNIITNILRRECGVDLIDGRYVYNEERDTSGLVDDDDGCEEILS